MEKQNYREEIHVLDLRVNSPLKYLVNVTNKSLRLLLWKGAVLLPMWCLFACSALSSVTESCW